MRPEWQGGGRGSDVTRTAFPEHPSPFPGTGARYTFLYLEKLFSNLSSDTVCTGPTSCLHGGTPKSNTSPSNLLALHCPSISFVQRVIPELVSGVNHLTVFPPYAVGKGVSN